jgi:hypothetical protein
MFGRVRLLISDRQRLAAVEARLDEHIAEANLTNRQVAATIIKIQTELDERRRRQL